MEFAGRRWTTAEAGRADVYGRVWTDPRELSPWVVLLDRGQESGGRAGPGKPRLVFRRGSEEWSAPVPSSVRLLDLEDALLRT